MGSGKCLFRTSSRPDAKVVSQPHRHDWLATPTFTQRLRPVVEPPVDPLHDVNLCVNGNRNAAHVVKHRLQVVAQTGLQLRQLWDRMLDKAPVSQEYLLSCIGKDNPDLQPISGFVDAIRGAMAKLFEDVLGRTVSCEEVTSGDYRTKVRGDVLLAWAQTARHPSVAVAKWFAEGTPAGIEKSFDVLDGIHPRVSNDSASASLEDIVTDLDAFANYEGVEDQDTVREQVEAFEKAGYLQKFQHPWQVRKFVGGDFVLSRLGAVENRNSTRPPELTT